MSYTRVFITVNTVLYFSGILEFTDICFQAIKRWVCLILVMNCHSSGNSASDWDEIPCLPGRRTKKILSFRNYLNCYINTYAEREGNNFCMWLILRIVRRERVVDKHWRVSFTARAALWNKMQSGRTRKFNARLSATHCPTHDKNKS